MPPPNGEPHAAELERELTSAEACDLLPYDDGFVPRSCTRAGRLLRQPALRRLPPGMIVMQGAVDPALALEAYEYTSTLGQPWGTYLTSNGESAPGELELQRIGAEPEVESLAARLLASFWRRGAAQLCGADLEHVHGFSVWAVVGDVGFKTAYHLDYAEVYRHRTNVIRPPLHAATLQVSPVPLGSFEGGSFGAHLDGLKHYEKHGYKTRREPAGDLPTTDWGTCERWQFAPYRFNQATLSNGELPHAADTVTAWPSHLRRVVIGINSMGRVEGPSECALPQHSKAFKRHLKLTQLEAMLRDMPPEARSKLVARAKGKVAARETARQGSQTSSTPD